VEQAPANAGTVGPIPLLEDQEHDENVQNKLKFRPGDLVQVKPEDEILATLDADGTLDRLPFMPEMLEYCGRRFRVSRRALKVCASGMKGGSILLGFPADDVVMLEELRCCGATHDGCQKACTILWKESWLRNAEGHRAGAGKPHAPNEGLRARLKTMVSPNTYFCQASEILRATKRLSRWERYTKWVCDIRAGNCSVLEMAQRFSIFLFWRVQHILFGPYGRGHGKVTPTEDLNLQPGDLVQVKAMQSISETLDEKASNRGLWFSPNMRLLCGTEQRVEKRIEKLIVDGTGEMRHMRNTVFLERSHCGCAHIAFGGCSRREYVYWREIWLRRAGDVSKSQD